MPKDPKRNIQSYQLQGGHLNEFEFQKSQSAMAEESELPFTERRGRHGRGARESGGAEETRACKDWQCPAYCCRQKIGEESDSKVRDEESDAKVRN